VPGARTIQRVKVTWGQQEIDTTDLTHNQLESLLSEVRWRERGLEVQSALADALERGEYKFDLRAVAASLRAIGRTINPDAQNMLDDEDARLDLGITELSNLLASLNPRHLSSLQTIPTPKTYDYDAQFRTFGDYLQFLMDPKQYKCAQEQRSILDAYADHINTL
jgi:hypothetical protein